MVSESKKMGNKKDENWPAELGNLHVGGAGAEGTRLGPLSGLACFPSPRTCQRAPQALRNLPSRHRPPHRNCRASGREGIGE